MNFPIKPEVTSSLPRTVPISVPATFTPSLDSSNLGRSASQFTPTSLSSASVQPHNQIIRPSPSHFTPPAGFGAPSVSTSNNPFLTSTSVPLQNIKPITCSTSVPLFPSAFIPPTEHNEPTVSSGFGILPSSHSPSLPAYAIPNTVCMMNPKNSNANFESRSTLPPHNSVQTMMDSLFISTGNHQFEDPEAWRYKRAEEMPMYFMEMFCKIQKECDNNEAVIAEGQRSVKILTKTSENLVGKCKHLTNYLQKVLAVQKRVQIALDVKQEYEKSIMKYVKELIKLSERADSVDMYSPVISPAGFITGFLELCEQRLGDIEKQVSFIEEMLRTESNPRNLKLLVSITALVHEKFTIISALTLEVHRKIKNLFRVFQGQMKNHSFSDISSENSLMIEHNKLKASPNPYANIRAIISGRNISNSNFY